jgi:hypothetical protein
MNFSYGAPGSLEKSVKMRILLPWKNVWRTECSRCLEDGQEEGLRKGLFLSKVYFMDLCGKSVSSRSYRAGA